MVNISSLVCYLLISAFLLSGCSATQFGDLFSSYTKQMRTVKSAQQRGDFQQALMQIPQRSPSDKSYNLSLLEQARLQFLSEQFSQSQQHFAQAYKLIEQEQQSAKIQLSKGVENVTAIVSNDSATRYIVPPYEQTMLHSYQALNYLSKQDLSGALVEIRRANLVQTNALRDNQNLLDKSQKSMKKQGVSSSSISQKYPSMNNLIGEVKNGFQNAFTFYLSGLLYEAGGQSNDAYIDYKKALEIYPDNDFLQQDIWRLANRLAMSDDIHLFKQRFKPSNQVVMSTVNTGNIVFVLEQGIIASKNEFSLNLPIFTSHDDMRFYSFAVPVYKNHLQIYSPLSLTVQGKQYQAQEIVRLQSLAAQQLKEQMPTTITRQVARIVAKEEIRQQLSRKGGDVGNILAGLYNITTEQADTRSWSTLPDQVQIMKISLPTGEHELNLMINGSNKAVKVKVKNQHNTLIYISAIGHNNNVNILDL